MDGQSILVFVINNLIEVAITIFMAAALPWLLQKLKLSNDDKTRAYVETAIRGGIKYAVAQIATSSNKPISDVAKLIMRNEEARNQMVGIASTYVQDNVPTGAKRLKLDEDQLSKVVASRAVDVAGEIVNADPTAVSSG